MSVLPANSEADPDVARLMKMARRMEQDGKLQTAEAIYSAASESARIRMLARDELTDLRARLARIREAAKPFAEAAKTLDMPGVDGYPFDDPTEVLWAGQTGLITVADFRALAQELEEPK